MTKSRRYDEEPAFGDTAPHVCDHRWMAQGNVWKRMSGQPRRAAASLTGKAVPSHAGVYAWYHQGEPVYSGRALGADGLHGGSGRTT